MICFRRELESGGRNDGDLPRPVPWEREPSTETRVHSFPVLCRNTAHEIFQALSMYPDICITEHPMLYSSIVVAAGFSCYFNAREDPEPEATRLDTYTPFLMDRTQADFARGFAISSERECTLGNDMLSGPLFQYAERASWLARGRKRTVVHTNHWPGRKPMPKASLES